MVRGALGAVVRQIRRMAGGDPTDRQLLEEFARSRSEDAFALLVERHGSFVLGVCKRVLKHEQDAEDVFQATFLVLAKKAGSLRWHDSVSGWLHGVAYRLALKARAEGLRRRAGERRAGERPPPPAPVTWEELVPVLDEELQRLPARYRLPLVLCYLQDRTRDEAAQELGWSPGAVKGRLERGRDLLRKRLRARGLTLSAALLAAALAEKTSLAVPGKLTAATALAGARVAAGQVVTGVVSAQALALARGALRATFLLKLRVAAVLLLALGTGSLLAHRTLARRSPAAPADAAPEPPPVRRTRPPARAAVATPARPRQVEVRVLKGVVRGVDPARRTLTLAEAGKDSTLGVARDARIVLGAREGSLRDLARGLRVNVTLAPDSVLAVAIEGERPFRPWPGGRWPRPPRRRFWRPF
jgi:RNA polymerase sigma factor (sigma-70 family)